MRIAKYIRMAVPSWNALLAIHFRQYGALHCVGVGNCDERRQGIVLPTFTLLVNLLLVLTFPPPSLPLCIVMRIAVCIGIFL